MDRIARGAGVTSAGQGVGRLLGYATQVALARMYGPGQLGFYVLGITLVQAVNILSQFGMDNGVVRYVAHHAASKDVARIRGTVIQALLVTFAFSVALSILMFFCAGFLADEVFGRPLVERVFRYFSLAVPFFTLMSIALWATQGFQTVKYATYVQQVLRPLINLGFVFVFYLLGVQILGAVVAYVLSMFLGSLLALYYLVRVFPQLLDWRIPAKFESRALFSASGPMLVANFTQQMNSWAAAAMLMIFSTQSAVAVGIFDAATRTANLSTLVLFAFTGIFSPMISSLHSRGLLSDLGYLYKDVSRWAFTGALAFFLITVLLAKDVMAVFGEEFVVGWPVVVVVAASQLFNVSVGPTARLLAMTGHQRIVLFSTLVSAGAVVGLCLLLIPHYDMLGAAVATAAAVILANAMTLVFVRWRLDFWPYSHEYAKPTLAGLIAAACVYLAQLALTPPPGLLTLAVFVPLFLMIFAGLLLALGLSPSDRRFLYAFWSAVRRTFRQRTSR
ncbi:MAG TPA: flippase [Rubrobacteraceae bacterium]|nr:flippase [Rubrobacteraceae bacterium]